MDGSSYHLLPAPDSPTIKIGMACAAGLTNSRARLGAGLSPTISRQFDSESTNRSDILFSIWRGAIRSRGVEETPEEEHIDHALISPDYTFVAQRLTT